MKKASPAITHDSFPQFVTQLENDSIRLNGQWIGRILASCLNVLLGSVIVTLVTCILYNSIPAEEFFVPYAVSHIPAFFRAAGEWALGLFPDGFNMWIAIVILLCAIPVSGLLTGAIFRFIPFRGKAMAAEPADTLAARTDNVDALIRQLQGIHGAMTEYFTFGVYVTPIVAGVAVLALPIASVCLANAGAEWYMVVAEVLAALMGPIFLPLFLLLVVACVLCFAAFWLAVAQEWVTSLFYRGHSFKEEQAQLTEYRALQEQEAADAHAAEVAAIEAQAIEQMLSGKPGAALGTLKLVENEAPDAWHIKWTVDMLAQDAEDVDVWIRWLEQDAESVRSQTLRAFLCERQAYCRERLQQLAEAEYPQALAALEGGDYGEAADRLRAADVMDYRDGVALFTLAEYCAGRTHQHKRIIERLTHGIDKGMESDKWELQCRQAIKRAEDALERIEWERREQERAKEAAMLEMGRQIIENFHCEYLVDGYCCRYCTIDNFPPGCYYVGKSRDQYMCDRRK